VLDVEPEDVVRDVVRVEAGIHRGDVRLVLVVPPALVVPERKHLGQRGAAGEARVARRALRGRRAQQQEEVDDAGLGEPVRRDARGAALLCDVNEHLGRVEPKGASGRARAVRPHERDGAVEAKRRVGVVLEDVEVVEAVRLGEVRRGGARGAAGVGARARAAGALGVRDRGAQRVRRRALGEAVDVVVPVEAEVKGERLGAARLRVVVRLERLGPPALRVALGPGAAPVLEGEAAVAVPGDERRAADGEGERDDGREAEVGRRGGLAREAQAQERRRALLDGPRALALGDRGEEDVGDLEARRRGRARGRGLGHAQARDALVRRQLKVEAHARVGVGDERGADRGAGDLERRGVEAEGVGGRVAQARAEGRVRAALEVLRLEGGGGRGGERGEERERGGGGAARRHRRWRCEREVSTAQLEHREGWRRRRW
jgi:hypothetical protein